MHLRAVNLGIWETWEDGAGPLLYQVRSGLMPSSLCCRTKHLYHTRRELLPAMSGCESHVCLVLRSGKEQTLNLTYFPRLSCFLQEQTHGRSNSDARSGLPIDGC